MAIPNVNVNVNEVSLAGQNVNVPFIPAVILKTKSGPIGQVTRVNTESQFISLFGQSDITTPAAFALQKYLRLYNFAYVTRVANVNEALEGSAELSFTDDEANIQKLVSVVTNYKTDSENGKLVKLVYDNTTNKLFIDLTGLIGRNITTVKEDLAIDANAVELEAVLEKLVISANAISGLPIKFTNEFKGKIDSDKVPTAEQYTAGFEAYFENGNSGNTTNVETQDILDLIDLYNYQDYPIDQMVIPEYRAYEVVNYAVEKGLINYYRVIAQATGTTVDEMQVSVQNYTTNNRGNLEIYAPDVFYSDLVDTDGNMVACPISIAVLNAYALTNRTNEWEAIAGFTNGTLPNVVGLSVKLSREQSDALYDGIIPINTINYISSQGYVVWGNKTTATEAQFFDRVNVSRLANYLTRELTQASWEFLFRPINLTLFTEFKAKLDGICEIVKNSDGIENYVVICNSSNNTDETIAKNQLFAQIQIKPVESLEFIFIDLTVTDTVIADVTEGGAQ